MAVRTSDPIADARRAVALDVAWNLGMAAGDGAILNRELILSTLVAASGAAFTRLNREWQGGKDRAQRNPRGSA
jgi:hypothetical protein